MGATRPGADADDVAFSTTSTTSNPGAVMQFFNSSQNPWSTSKLPVAMPARRSEGVAGGKPEICGWYDSSFDLSTGLEVSEQDSDTLYQLWELSQN
jgi:hypothetical protein